MSLDGHFAHDFSTEEAEGDRLEYQHSQRVAAIVAAAGNPPLVSGEPVVTLRPVGPVVYFRVMDGRGEWIEGFGKVKSASDRDGRGYYYTAITQAPWVGYRRGDETRLVGVAGESTTGEECVAKMLAGIPPLASRRWGYGRCLAIEFHAARPAFWDEAGSPLPKAVAP